MWRDEVGGDGRRHALKEREAADHEAAVNVLDAGGGLGREEDANAREGGGFGDFPRIESARHGRGSDGFAQDIGEDLDAAGPFLKQLRGRQMRHPLRMGEGMAADDVAAVAEGTNLRGVQKARRADIAGGDQEVGGPSVAIEKAGNAGIGGLAAVIEGEEEGKVIRGGMGDFGGTSRLGCADAGDGGEMLFKLGESELVSGSAGAAETNEVPIAGADDVVIEKGDRVHVARFRARCFQRRYLVSQGCPQVAEERPETSRGRAEPA